MPTYKYRNEITGQEVDVIQKITEDSFSTWGEVVGSDSKDRAVRVPNWEGYASITGQGVYKQGVISAASNPKEKPPKAGAIRITEKDLKERDDES